MVLNSIMWITPQNSSKYEKIKSTCKSRFESEILLMKLGIVNRKVNHNSVIHKFESYCWIQFIIIYTKVRSKILKKNIDKWNWINAWKIEVKIWEINI
jgi:hypothetical protein